jgi:hypothetical protein
LWIGISTMQAVVCHLMHPDMSLMTFKRRNQRVPYRFIRVCQLKNLPKINQQISPRIRSQSAF